MVGLARSLHNWLVDFFDGRSHRTKQCHEDELSTLRSISGSITHDSATGPASYRYVTTGSDLHAVAVGNELCKYADDTYT